MSARRVVAAALLLGAALCPGLVLGQGLEGAGGAYNIQRRMLYQGSVFEQKGFGVWGSGAARLGPVRIGLSGWMGTLTGDGTGNADVKARSTTLTAHVRLGGSLLVGAQLEGRRLETDLGTTVWQMAGLNVRFEPGFGVPGLRGLADVSLLPSSKVQDGPKIKTAMQATVGASFQPPRLPLFARLAYRFERYDLEATALTPERLEQFRGLMVEVGVRLGR